MRVTHDRTKRPRGALLQLGLEMRWDVRRIGGSRRSGACGHRGDSSEIPLSCYFVSHAQSLKQESGQDQAGSLTGAVASQRVTEVPKGSLRVNGNHPVRVERQKGA
jgi:hypothetical protein